MALPETAYYIMINSQVGSKSNFIQDIKIKKKELNFIQNIREKNHESELGPSWKSFLLKFINYNSAPAALVAFYPNDFRFSFLCYELLT